MSQHKIKKQVVKMAQAAKEASWKLALISADEKNKALTKMAQALGAHKEYIIKENAKDVLSACRQNLSKAVVDRLRLDDKRIREMVEGLKDTAKLKDPVGEVMRMFKRPNGLFIKKVRVPIGVIGIIYESRPNVTSDCISLCLKSGNAVILKGGKEVAYSNQAIFNVLKNALRRTAIPQGAIQLVDSKNREAIQELLKLDNYVDLIVPRGGEGLIRFVAEHSRIPVVKHYKGVCHTYVSDKANLEMARKVCLNAKVQRPATCNAMETLLVHKKIAPRFLPVMIREFQQAGVEIRGDEQTRRIFSNGVKKATLKDWDEEYLDLILSVKVVNDLEEAMEHINSHGTKHSDAIITQNKREAEAFLKTIDSACLYVNASTRFTDGYQFGFGAEVGISTDKLHARGPMALEELTTYKYLVYGKGQIRQ